MRRFPDRPLEAYLSDAIAQYGAERNRGAPLPLRRRAPPPPSLDSPSFLRHCRAFRFRLVIAFPNANGLTLCEHTESLQRADLLEAFYPLVVPPQDLVGSLQEIGALFGVTVIVVKVCLGGRGGVGNHLIS
jgi:hypothetical protein